MTSMLVNIIIAFWLLLFGAMAIIPFMLDSKPQTRSSESNATATVHAEDRVISIRPVGIGLVRTQEQGTQTPADILAAASARAAAQASLDDRGGVHHRQAA